MARNSTWTNADGLEVGFGTRDSKSTHPATIRTEGNVEIHSMILDWDNLPAAGTTAHSSKDIPIPAGALVHRATLRVLVAFASAGATTLGIGTENAAGADLDIDGIDVAIAKTVIDAVGDAVQCDGALVGGLVDVGTVDAYIVTSVATGPYTAGQAELTVEYSRPLPDTDPSDPITTEV